MPRSRELVDLLDRVKQLEDAEQDAHGTGSEVRRALGIARVQLAGAARAAHAREQASGESAPRQ